MGLTSIPGSRSPVQVVVVPGEGLINHYLPAEVAIILLPTRVPRTSQMRRWQNDSMSLVAGFFVLTATYAVKQNTHEIRDGISLI